MIPMSQGSLLYSSGERVEDNSMLFVLRGEASIFLGNVLAYLGDGAKLTVAQWLTKLNASPDFACPYILNCYH